MNLRRVDCISERKSASLWAGSTWAGHTTVADQVEPEHEQHVKNVLTCSIIRRQLHPDREMVPCRTFPGCSLPLSVFAFSVALQPTHNMVGLDLTVDPIMVLLYLNHHNQAIGHHKRCHLYHKHHTSKVMYRHLPTPQVSAQCLGVVD